MSKDKNLLNLFYNLLKKKAHLCLAPGMDCNAKPINAHSIQNAKIFEILHSNNHVIGLGLNVEGHKKPEIGFKYIGRNKASTFEGLCSKHDNSIFEVIDRNDLNLNDNKHLFLIAYRSVLKELHASLTKGFQFQTMYLEKVRLNLLPKDYPSHEGIIAAEHLINAYDFFLYKENFDNFLINNDFGKIHHTVYELATDQPLIACSQTFSADHISFEDTVLRLTINVLPFTRHKTRVIFSYTDGEQELAKNFLQRISESQSHLRNYYISKVIIENCENFFINPVHFEKWSESKKKKILELFTVTMFNPVDQDSEDFYLF